MANIFDRLQKRLNNNIIAPIDTLMNEINTRTKANIIHSILGLGQICRQQQQHPELVDMPDIVNFLEGELRELNVDDYTHRTRGQRPLARDDQDADTEIMMDDYTHRTRG
eukprot:11085895-Heterocapsa_arctica.AAC.1